MSKQSRFTIILQSKQTPLTADEIDAYPDTRRVNITHRVLLGWRQFDTIVVVREDITKSVPVFVHRLAGGATFTF